MMRLLAVSVLFALFCGTLCAQNQAKPKKPGTPAKPVAAEAPKPAPKVKGPVVVEAPAETIYVEPKPMKGVDPQVRFAKIYDFINDPSETSVGDNAAMAYEFKYFNYGAVTKADLKKRKGHYFVVNWKNAGPAEDLTLRLDYRQEKSRDRINTLEIPSPAASGNLKGIFSVRGDAYERYGRVNSWRLSIIRKGQIVAEKKSYIW